MYLFFIFAIIASVLLKGEDGSCPLLSVPRIIKPPRIIAEYNPFHNGHAYQIREIRRRSGADFVVAVMSGDFVQRGTPALLDKYARTRMALLGGADLVLELPCAAACGSAARFAGEAVRILDGLGVVQELWFGSEAGKLEPLAALGRACWPGSRNPTARLCGSFCGRAALFLCPGRKP